MDQKKERGKSAWRRERSERSQADLVTAGNQVFPPPGQSAYTPAYRLKVLAEAAGCTQPGELAALARREGLYISTITKWKAQQKRMEALGGGIDMAKHMEEITKLQQQLKASEREKRGLERKLERANRMLEYQKKSFALMEELKRTQKDGEKSP